MGQVSCGSDNDNDDDDDNGKDNNNNNLRVLAPVLTPYKPSREG